MSRTLTALFDSRADAEAAKARLEAANIDISGVHVHDQQSTGYNESSAYSTHENKGFWGSVKNAFLPDEDRHTYEEGIRRGGALLTAEVDEDDADEAVRVLESANSIDLDDRSQSWRQSGWDYDQSRHASTGTGAGMATGAALGATGSAIGAGTTGRADMTDRLTTGGTEKIDVVEEELVVGKREVNRGGVRVRSYVREVPVEAEVDLRATRVYVERRPVDRALNPGDVATGEQVLEAREHGEQAVVGKEARVVEEIGLRQETEVQHERIQDTVRKTEVEIEDERTGNRTGLTGGTRGTGSGTF